MTHINPIQNIKNNKNFIYKQDKNGNLISLSHKDDEYKMNWLSGKEIWGDIVAPKRLSASVSREFTENGNLRETYTFKNETDYDIYLSKSEIGIFTTFPDDYTSSAVCMKERCHVHVWCGSNTAYIEGVRMSNKPPHLGLILIDGSIDGYSIKRDLKAQSNDRGSFILHPEKAHLKPNESYIITWDLVWFESRDEFRDKIKAYENTAVVNMSSILSFKGDTNNITVDCKENISKENIKIFKNKKEVKDFIIDKNKILITDPCNDLGEFVWDFYIDGKHTVGKSLVVSKMEEFIEKRCKYIVEKQQYIDETSYLHGAYVPFDVEDDCIYYSNERPDHNAARERLGMGALMAKFLQTNFNQKMADSLEKYTEFIYREVYDSETGEVFNDAKRNTGQYRLYNYPWIAILFIERYHLYGLEKDLIEMHRVIKKYYVEGGHKFYAIGIPMEESIELLEKNNMLDKANELKDFYILHGERILENGLIYPAHEVKYEQSIVGPSVSMLIQLYLITKDKKYLTEGQKQLNVLELFNGDQPDYHMYEVAIRHWDGYWFGKRRLYGDTFPHYWSSLTGNAYYLYYRATNNKDYLQRTEYSLRGSLSMFFEDGSATCAYVYPETVNGIKGNFADPWANDQDWAMYFYLKYYFDLNQ